MWQQDDAECPWEPGSLRGRAWWLVRSKGFTAVVVIVILSNSISLALDVESAGYYNDSLRELFQVRHPNIPTHAAHFAIPNAINNSPTTHCSHLTPPLS